MTKSFVLLLDSGLHILITIGTFDGVSESNIFSGLARPDISLKQFLAAEENRNMIRIDEQTWH